MDFMNKSKIFVSQLKNLKRLNSAIFNLQVLQTQSLI